MALKFRANLAVAVRPATPFLYALTNSVWTSGQIFIAGENCLRTLGEGREEEQTALIS